MIFKKKIYREQHYDFFSVALAIKDNEFSFEEIQTLKVIAARYLRRSNEEDAQLLATILKNFRDDSSDFGPAAICKEIIRVGA